jgi:hypothetical protein
MLIDVSSVLKKSPSNATAQSNPPSEDVTVLNDKVADLQSQLASTKLHIIS